MNEKPVFISHAAANEDVADALVDFLQTGLGINQKDIFCSSLEGMGVPPGENFVNFIRGQIEKPKVVIQLLTVDYFKSQFCLCELGASWALAHNVVPLLVRPLEYNDMKAVLVGIQVLKIEDKSNLNTMRDQINNTLKIKGSTARWELKRDEFINKLGKCKSLNKAEKPITKAQFEELKIQYNDAMDELKICAKTVESKNIEIDKLKKLKDAKGVQSVVESSLDGKGKFDALVDNATSAIQQLPTIVREALYYHMRDESLPGPSFGEDGRHEDIRTAIEEDYLRGDGNSIEVVEGDPKVSTALGALAKLEKFIKNADEDNPDLADWYSEKFKHRLIFKSKRFWDAHLL